MCANQPERLDRLFAAVADAGGWDLPTEDRPTLVTGPDWALLAWLIARPAATAGALNQTPDLSPWR